MEEFQGRDNRLFWFAQDINVISKIIADVPEQLPKILTVHAYRFVESWVSHFRPGQDIFLQPKPIFRDPVTADPDRDSQFSIWPGLFTDLDPETYHWDLRRRFHVASRSVAFSAIFFSLHFDFERVIGLGMDLPSRKVTHPHAGSCGQSLHGKGFGTVARDKALKQLVSMARFRRIKLFNASPLAETDIIPKKGSIALALR